MQVVELMELGPLAGALVGTPGQSGLSVEQRKRLTIGVELCANPSIIFMDEPTSGSASVAKTLAKNFATKPRFHQFLHPNLRPQTL